MGKFKNYDELSVALSNSDNVLTVDMAELRDVNGSGRLGPYVVDAISNELAAKGIGHYPEVLPQLGWEKARLYRLGSPVADLYRLLTEVSDDHDERLREFGADDAKRKLDQIRQIVC